MHLRDSTMKRWLPVLIMLLVGLQSMTVVANALPLHPLNAEHLLNHETESPRTQVATSVETKVAHSEPAELTHHCHTDHCHGSHLLLAMQPADLKLRFAARQLPVYRGNTSEAHPAIILRPPKA